MKITGSEIITKFLENNEVKYIFGVPGGHLLKFYNSLYDSDQINPILTKHESGASFMATGYAQVSGKVGVCTGTVGPGATNLMTGVASAYMDSVPILVITAQVGASAIGKGGLQEGTGEGRTIDHVELFNGASKYSTRIYSVEKTLASLSNAYRTSINGRPGPSHIDVLADVFAGYYQSKKKGVFKKIEKFNSSGSIEDIEKASNILLSAKKPAIIAGNGSVDASEEILNLSKTLGIPVATTLKAKGVVPEDYDLALGCLGLYGTNIANKYMRSGIDVLLAIGTSFSEFTTHNWDTRFKPTRSLIQIDVDPWEVDKNFNVDIGIIGDAKFILDTILRFILERKKSGHPELISKEILKLKKERNYFSDPKMDSNDVPIKPQRLMKSLRKVLPKDSIIFGDIGNTLTWLEGFYQVYQPKSFFICSSMASMGYGVSASIGGQLAAPERKVICVAGDGDFLMQGMEVVTAVNYNIPVKWFILNNQKLAMISDIQDILFSGRRISATMKNPDFVKMAEAMGALGYRISKPEELEPICMEVLKNDRPSVIDVQIDPEEVPSFDARAEAMVRAWGVSPPIIEKIKMVPEFLKRR